MLKREGGGGDKGRYRYTHYRCRGALKKKKKINFSFLNLAQPFFFFLKKTLLQIIYKEDIYNINLIVIRIPCYNLYFVFFFIFVLMPTS
jgi:hypothetical protein